ncbi:MAG: hypothetical protein ACP5SI_00065 [Chloroflexia bacterium]
MCFSLELDELLGRLKQLQTRYPSLIRDVRAGPLHVDVEFYLVDLAIDATHCLLEQGITAVHRMDFPRLLSLQLPSLALQQQMGLLLATLDGFLRRQTERMRKPTL